MRKLLLAPWCALALAGCSAEPTATPIESEEPPATSSTAPAGGSSVAPMTSGAAGAVSPVTGAESVQGGGSGINQAAKDKARDVAAGAGGGSADAYSDGE